MHVQKVIEKFGYKPQEARVYLTVLAFGECTIADIVQKTKLPRSSVLMVVDRLHADGLLNFYTKRRSKYWVAENPQKFLITLRENEAALQAVLPELSALRHAGGGKPTVKVFMGEKDIRLIHQDILATKHHVVAIIPWDNWVSLLGSDYVEDFIETRTNHFLKLRLLAPKTKSSLRLKERDAAELRQTRFLPERMDIADAIFIYANKVAIISLNDKQPTGIVIDDSGTCRTMTVFFEELWGQAVE